MQQKTRQLIWLQGALDDLTQLKEVPQLKQRANVIQHIAKTIQNMAEQVLESPQLGNPVSDLPEYRDYSVQFGNRRYMLRYRLMQEAIYITHVRYYYDENYFS